MLFRKPNGSALASPPSKGAIAIDIAPAAADPSSRERNDLAVCRVGSGESVGAEGI
jgi:hypothetical protein